MIASFGRLSNGTVNRSPSYSSRLLLFYVKPKIRSYISEGSRLQIFCQLTQDQDMSRRLSRLLHQKLFLVCAKHNISSSDHHWSVHFSLVLTTFSVVLFVRLFVCFVFTRSCFLLLR